MLLFFKLKLLTRSTVNGTKAARCKIPLFHKLASKEGIVWCKVAALGSLYHYKIILKLKYQFSHVIKLNDSRSTA